MPRLCYGDRGTSCAMSHLRLRVCSNWYEQSLGEVDSHIIIADHFILLDFLKVFLVGIVRFR
jgi:hypothetical protein